MTTRADTVHALHGHVSVANSNNPVTAQKKDFQTSYQYNPETHAVNKFISQGAPKTLSQTFQVNSRSSSNPMDISPVMMIR